MITSGKVYRRLWHYSAWKNKKQEFLRFRKKLLMLIEHLEEDQSYKPTLEKQKC